MSNPTDITTILIIDDHPLFRKGVRNLISMDQNLSVIGEATGGKDGVERALELIPDMILIDIDMKDMSGIETLELLKSKKVESIIVMLTVSDHEDNVINALRSGADGYLLKDMEPEDILDKIGKAASGETVISEQLTTLLAKSLRNNNGSSKEKSVADKLTSREEEIILLVMEGMSNKMIARELDISDGTVKVHMKHILKKLGLKTRVEAAIWAIKNYS
ncbi:MAG: two-component system response regulator NarL [Thiotrichales bacterium]|nr:two-component system response regulator NarL [Thiotrichales bacterium]MBT3613879.1 two-component system response regulator NarL [Thiotrichales bacterium]MBT3752955.1 two-component system response regulator NarL [Thiotrichales bacterium]MBT3838173.1 two-component system response regulator NarL [Thiotrichales bacterium]MBT4151811.1 two-component system response regulator NarL [Thiotrichales bacterium]